MAHRQPLGTTTLPMTFDWEGPKPTLGDFLMTGAGTWYRVVGELETRNPAKVKLVLERIVDPTPEERASHAVHEFWWYPREKRRVA